jgi:4-diphosphocytidyl-2-C-methyl-D-erythritol kinase
MRIQRIAYYFNNALLPITAGLIPEINGLITLMRRTGAANASMTGSGPTVFGYFTDKITALGCLSSIQNTYPAITDIFLSEITNY